MRGARGLKSLNTQNAKFQHPSSQFVGEIDARQAQKIGKTYQKNHFFGAMRGCKGAEATIMLI